MTAGGQGNLGSDVIFFIDRWAYNQGTDKLGGGLISRS